MTMLERHTRVIAAMESLQRAVDELNRAYDAPELNDEQPPEMIECIPMSIDEWSFAVTAATEAWRRVAAQCAAEQEHVRPPDAAS